jgi:hypothetical protein
MLEEESGTTEEILQKSKQFYSGEKTELIMKQMVKKFGVFQDFIGAKVEEKGIGEKKIVEVEAQKSFESLDNAIGVLKNTAWGCEYVKIEEFNGKLPDIDDLKGFVEKTHQAETVKNNVQKTAVFVKKNAVNSITVMNLEQQLNNSNISKKSQNATKKQTNLANLNQSEESILNKSTLDVQMGFTISKVKSLYPNRLCKELITPLDKVIQKDEYKWQTVLDDEKIALPAATLISNVLFGVIENEENQNIRDFLKKKNCMGCSAIIDMFFKNSGANFEKIFLVKK